MKKNPGKRGKDWNGVWVEAKCHFKWISNEKVYELLGFC